LCVTQLLKCRFFDNIMGAMCPHWTFPFLFRKRLPEPTPVDSVEVILDVTIFVTFRNVDRFARFGDDDVYLRSLLIHVFCFDKSVC